MINQIVNSLPNDYFSNKASEKKYLYRNEQQKLITFLMSMINV